MKRILSLLLLTLIFAANGFSDEAPPALVDFIHKELTKLENDPIIVTAVKAQNAQGKSLAQIKALDEQWKATPGIADYMEALMTSQCARHLKELQDRYGFLSEIFVMDNQGANVAMTDKTSDYWQGDEAKFEKSFNNGKGAVFIDEVEFDNSTQTYLVQASIPVKESGKVIGAITFGIDIDAFESR